MFQLCSDFTLCKSHILYISFHKELADSGDLGRVLSRQEHNLKAWFLATLISEIPTRGWRPGRALTWPEGVLKSLTSYRGWPIEAPTWRRWHPGRESLSWEGRQSSADVSATIGRHESCPRRCWMLCSMSLKSWKRKREKMCRGSRLDTTELSSQRAAVSLATPTPRAKTLETLCSRFAPSCTVTFPQLEWPSVTRSVSWTTSARAPAICAVRVNWKSGFYCA